MKQYILKGDQVPFTQVPNSVLENKNISLRAKGMWTYLYSKPDGYDFSVNRMPVEIGDGRKICMAVMKELEKAGYLVRQRRFTGKVEYTIYFEPKSLKGTQGLTKPQVPKSLGAEKELRLYNSNTKTTTTNKEGGRFYQNPPLVIVQRKKPDTETPIITVAPLFEPINVAWKTWYANKTQRLAAKTLLEPPFGIEKVKKVLLFFIEHREEQYCPQISTPYDLVQKWSKLQTFRDKQRA